MPSTRTTVKRSKGKEQKQQHVFNQQQTVILMTSVTLVKSCTLQKVFEISTRSNHTGFTAAPHEIPNVLEDSWHVSHLPGTTEMRATTFSTESILVLPTITGVLRMALGFLCTQERT
ncbi:hypothetical protein AVEN_48922-1 [Araneus ventricosus]|uniref:Uncharacterized protein n=1 Tax=Araneus ventricosus TaxID=182803 RepID=A0A4Y2AID0_ARAVE|nr:hypothetical protein AVEN_48922-1 [Araneus ventricosus]